MLEKLIKLFHYVNTLELHLMNYYLERNIIEGIGEVLANHETVIVLEDDICTSPIFLEYINGALQKYADHPRDT